MGAVLIICQMWADCKGQIQNGVCAACMRPAVRMVRQIQKTGSPRCGGPVFGAAGQIRTADLVITKSAYLILYRIYSCYIMPDNPLKINSFLDFWNYLVLSRFVLFLRVCWKNCWKKIFPFSIYSKPHIAKIAH